MKVRTVRKHINRHAPQPTKNIGRIYEVSDREGENLISSGLVEAVGPKSE